MITIGIEAFSGCNSLTTIIVEKGNSIYDSRSNCNAIIKTADNELISGCKSTIIPNSVTSIGKRAFSSCSMTSVAIPSNVTTIGDAAFEFCDSLTSVTIRNGVMSIGKSAFSWCSSLTSVTIPNSVTTIGDGAFALCPSLTSVYSYIENPFPLETEFYDVFYEIHKDAVLYVPKGPKGKYEATQGWPDHFAEIVEADGIDNVMVKDGKSSSVYDLSGKRLFEPTKGINIIDGKKILVK